MSRIVTYNDIYKRKMILESGHDSFVEKNCNLLFHRLKSNNSLENKKNFILECSKSRHTVNKHLRVINQIVRETNDLELTNIFENNILPMVELERTVLGIISPDNLQIKKNHICDFILKNHNTLFNESEIKEYIERKTKGNFGTNIVLLKCCETISNHKDVPVYGKINIALQEFFYLAGKYNLQYHDNDIVNETVTYFSINENILDSKDIININESLKENMLYEYSENDNNDNQFISLFLTSPVKNSDLLLSILDDVVKSEEYNMVDNITKFIKLLSSIIISSNDYKLCHDIYSTAVPAIYEKFYNNKISSDNIKQLSEEISNKINIEISYCKELYNSIDIAEVKSILGHYEESLRYIFNCFEDIKNVVYTQYNLECMKNYINESNSIQTIQEFKLFKQKNLINYIVKIDKFISDKFRNIRNNYASKIKQIKNKIFCESDNIYDIITEEGFIDFTLYSYKILSENVDNSLHDLFTTICKEINSFIINESNYRTYYLLEGDTITINIKCDEKLELSDEEKDKLSKNLPDKEKELIFNISRFDELINDNILDLQQLESFLINNIENREVVSYVIEILQYIGLSKSILEFTFNSISLHDISRSAKIDNNRLMENYQPVENTDISIIIEASNILSVLLEDNKDDISKEDKKNPFSGVNLNNIKLYLEGLKKKAKDLSSKEQQVSRQVDVTFSNFVRNVKNVLISDRRESIIKGSVIPSFSKCIKIGIGLIGLGVVTQNPLVPIIAAIGGLAMSKKLTQKERLLLLDEIETELEVIEKEIQIADSKNQMKKLRALMRTKKDLQRQYQRIKYNIRVGKDLIPSSAGVPNKQ